MNPSASHPEKSRSKWLWSFVFVFLVGLLAWMIFQWDHTVGAAKLVPIRVLEFEDGKRIEVIVYAVGGLECVENPGKRKSGISKDGTTVSSHADFAGGGFQTTIKTLNGTPERWSAAPEKGFRPLLLGIRILGGAEQAIPVKRSYSDFCIHHDDRLIPRTANSREISASGFTPNLQDSDIESAMAEYGLEWLVEHQDPDSGWVVMEGPLWIGEAFPSSHVVALPSWRRDQRELRFRVTSSRGERIEFSLPNPAIGVSPPPLGLPAIKARNPPFEIIKPDYKIALNSLHRHVVDGYIPGLKPSMEFQATGFPQEQGEAFFIASAVGAYDEWGNYVPCIASRFMRLPWSSTTAGIVYEVEKSTFHPVDRNGAFIFARGEVLSDGASAKIELLPAAAEFGITTPERCEIVPFQDRWYPWLEGDRSLHFKCSGKFDSGKVQRPFGNTPLKQLNLIFFAEGEVLSSGRPCFAGSNESRSDLSISIGGIRSQSVEFEKRTNWNAPDGKLAPGQRFEVGMHPQFEAENVVLPVHLPIREN